MSNFLTLPSVILCEILDLMDLHNLKKLRCVCKETKNMVEKSKYMQKFKISLKDIEDQEIVMSSKVPWNNFVVNTFLDHMLKKDQVVLPGFLAQFGKSMEHLETQMGLNNEVPIILGHLSSRIKTLILEEVSIDPSSFQSPTWAKNFIKLRKLQISRIMNLPDAQKTLFEVILENCTHHLSHLRIPIMVQCDGSQTTQLHYTSLIFQPVLNYLKRIEESQVQTSLIIDFKGVAKLDPEILLSLVQISSRLGVKLHNVPIDGFPMDNRSLKSVQRKMFEKSIVSVAEFVEYKIESNFGYNKHRFVPKSAQLHVGINVEDVDNRNEVHQGFDIRGPIHTFKITAILSPSLRHTYQAIFRTQRPTVRNLKIRHFDEREESPLNNFGEDISFSFPNIKELLVSYCSRMRTQDFHALIHGLPCLEKLVIVNSNLKDQGLLGDDLTHPYIFKLKNLKHLELMLCNGLTDVSFTHAFRFMNLLTFKWTYEDYESCQVTFLDGISSLNSIDGGLKDSVQHLEFKSPGDCDREDVDEFVNQFKSLTYFNVEKNPLIESECENESTDDDEIDGESYSENLEESGNDNNENESSEEEAEEDQPQGDSESDDEDEELKNSDF